MPDTPNIQGPITTADSAKSGRLVQDLQGMKKKKRKIVEKAIDRVAHHGPTTDRPNRDMPNLQMGKNYKAKEPLRIRV